MPVENLKIIGFFSKRCGHCIDFMPLFKDFKLYHDINPVLDEYGDPVLSVEMYVLYGEHHAEAVEAMRLYGVTMVPTVLIVDSGNRVKDPYSGPRTREGLDEMVDDFLHVWRSRNQ